MRFEPSDALIIVDLQRDFCAGGKLPVPGADEITPLVNRLIVEAEAAGALVVATRDWHPRDHSSFKAFGGPWPEHCVQGSEGALFHPGLRLPPDALLVSKGERREPEQYSDFDATGLPESLHRRGVRRVIIVGLALDVCVRASALDAVRLGFETCVVMSAVRAISPEGGKKTLAEFAAAGVRLEEEGGAP